MENFCHPAALRKPVVVSRSHVGHCRPNKPKTRPKNLGIAYVGGLSSNSYRFTRLLLLN